MARSDLLLPSSTRRAPPPPTRRTAAPASTRNGSFASLVSGRSTGSTGSRTQRSSGVRQETQTVNNQNAAIQRSSAPSSFKSLTSAVASGSKDKAKDTGVLGAVGGLVHDIPGVGWGLDKAGEFLAAQPVQDVLKTIDIPRAAVVSAVDQGAEALGLIPDNHEDFGTQFNRRMSYRDVVDSVDLPGWAKGITGFAGDIALDPTSYIGVGLGKAGIEGVTAAGRSELAQQIVTRAGAAGLQDAEMQAAERLAAEAGKRGRGALTTRGLKTANVESELAAKLGMQPTFGIQVRIPGWEKSVGGRRVVQAVEDVKGAVKARLADTVGGRIMRQLRSPDFDAALNDVLFSGKGSAHTRASAARVLAATHMGRGESATLIDRMSRWTKSELRPLLKKNVDWEQAIHEVETGAIKSDGAKKLDEFFGTLADAAEAAGIPFDRRQGYVPHRATLEAKNFMTDPEAFKPFGMDMSKLTEKFEKPRQIQVGDKWFGETVKDTSVRNLNSISRRVVGFDFFETNPDKLIAKTLGEAGDAAERHARNRALQAMGAPVEEVQRVIKEVVDPKTAERIKKLSSLESRSRRQEADLLQKATNKRQYAVQAATRALQSRGKKLVGELSRAEVALDRSVDELNNLARQRTAAEGALQAATVARDHAVSTAETARLGARRDAMRRVDQLRGEVATRQARVDSLKATHEQLVTDTAEAEQLFTQAVLKHMDDARLAAAAAQRKVSQTVLRDKAVKAAQVEGEAFNRAVHASETAAGAVEKAGKPLAKAEQGLASARAETQALAAAHPNALPEVQTVAKVKEKIANLSQVERAVQLEKATTEQLVPHLQARAEELEAAVQEGVTAHGASFAKRKLKNTSEREMASMLAEKARMLSEVLQREGMDKHVATVAKYEGQALALESDALLHADRAAMRADTISALKDANVRRQITRKIKDGFTDIGGGYQTMDSTLATQLSSVVSIFDSPKASAALLKGWDSWNKWFRTWAVTSPGFIVRNVEGGWLNNLIAGVKMQDYKQFRQHFNVYKSGSGWENRFMDKFGVDELHKFKGALDAIAGTGWGQSAQEAGIGLFSKHGGRRAFDKTVGTENPLSIAVRNKNEGAEEMMRGALAYATFRRSGKDALGAWPVNDAMNQVAKYHFNYRDISSFDRAAKRVIPFWTFMSRNIPLQLDNLAKHPDVLNRTYGNLKRVLESGQQNDPVVPSYFMNLGGIKLGDVPGIGSGGDSEYLILDLPFLRVQSDLNKFTDIEQMFSDMNPAIKTPLELQAHKQFFSGIPLSDTRMETPPAVAKVPGVKQLLEQVGWLQKDAQGHDVMSDAHAYAIEAMSPMTNRVDRIVPPAQKRPGEPGYDREKQYLADKQKESLLSILLGVGIRTNSPERQQGELLRRSRELKTLLDEAKTKGYVKG
jgi:hypothetical protein